MPEQILKSILDGFTSQAANSGGLTDVQRNYIDVLKSGDIKRGEELATNLCNSIGVSREEAVSQAQRFFGF